MAKLSRQTKETIQTIAVILLVVVLILAYVVYPLNRTKTLMGRTNIDDYEPDSTLINDATPWIESGLVVDTFRVEADGLTTLAGLHAVFDSSATDSLSGTALLLHGYHQDRDSLLALGRYLAESGYGVVAVDQRAAGRSTGQYFGEGQYESDDLIQVISYLEIRGLIHHPLVVVGFDHGADAALIAAGAENRIDAVVAVTPYLSTARMFDQLMAKHATIWFPFDRSMMWWWYNIRSSYAASYRETEQVPDIVRPTLLIVPAELREDAEVVLVIENADKTLLTLEDRPTDGDLINRLTTFISSIPH